jgi:hypothetical protein
MQALPDGRATDRAFLHVRRINEYADEIIAEDLVIVLRQPVDRLSFARDRAEMLPQCEKGICNQLIWNRLAIIKPAWQ